MLLYTTSTLRRKPLPEPDINTLVIRRLAARLRVSDATARAHAELGVRV